MKTYSNIEFPDIEFPKTLGLNPELELKDLTATINDMISKSLPSQGLYDKKIIDALNYSMEVGGKRLRPILMLAAARLFYKTESTCGDSYSNDSHSHDPYGHDSSNDNSSVENSSKDLEARLIMPFMLAIEMIHTYSLVHDDLPAMDNDDYRRGNLTTHKKFGEDFGILAGDALLNLAYETCFAAIEAQDRPEYMRRAIKAASILSRKAGIYGMVGGQCLDVFLTDKPMDKDQLDYIFKLKTGALIEASCMVGVALAGASDEDIKKIELAASKTGYAFQIQDDILDVTSTTEELGKPVLSDEKNNKTTYVTLYGLTKAHEDVEKLSYEAISIIDKYDNSDFMIWLIKKLIDRKK